MPSVFAALEDRAWAEWRRIMGEDFEHRPQVAAPGGGRRTADDGRAVRLLTAVLEEKEHRSTEFGSEARGSMPVTMTKTWAHVDTSELDGAARPERLDLFVRLATGDIYEIAQIERDGEGRLKLSLKHIGKE